jgi:hypothetical protein
MKSLLSTQKLLAGPAEMHTRALLIAFLPCVRTAAVWRRSKLLLQMAFS